MKAQHVNKDEEARLSDAVETIKEVLGGEVIAVTVDRIDNGGIPTVTHLFTKV